MQKIWVALFVLLSMGVCLSQSLSDISPQGAASQGAASQGMPADCSDPALAGTAGCSASQSQRSSGGQGSDPSSSIRNPVLRSPSGFNTDQYFVTPAPLNPSQVPHSVTPLRPETE